ncbi:PREDICTED: U1 small nuclear ribonucleoprotein 70 kDa-like [Cyphomyrmex costatus]|uniref:U1 small nuclear ribonucleoprotein 70 kDa-like n=1 Tax=Cyphomyrmex costatus TaxID=456900 RepID=UPI0008522CE3|nr:PREDICTED: U1 small nuclear ribonucleoprotein 70 kDa-like [Cyphomyrmex costatus]
MNPIRSTTFRGGEESRSTRNEDNNTYAVLRSRTEEEKQRRRREWQRQQERERQHEKLKQQKILEYERKRAQALKYTEEKSSRHSQSKSGSESPTHVQYRGRSASTASKSGSLHEKLDGSSSGTIPLFRGPQNAQIDTSELRRIKVDIHRNIPAKGPVTELQRDILNPEDVIVKRRDGEGCKPIFDREELKKIINKTNEIEERRTVVAIDKEQSASTTKSRSLRRRSLSLSPIRNRVYSGNLSSYTSSRRAGLKHQDKTEKCDTREDNGRGDLEKRREYKEKYTERDANKHNTNRSRSRESRNSHSRPFIEERSYRDRYRERSNERSYERRDRDRGRDRDRDRDRERDRERDRNRDRTKDRNRSRERRDIAPHYIESPIPVPIYYGSFPPRPIVVSPMVPLRGQIPPMGRGRHPTLMAPVRPFPPRFPPDIYRLGHPPPNPRYGPF